MIKTRSGRSVRKPERLGAKAALVVAANPKNVKQKGRQAPIDYDFMSDALKSEYAPKWLGAGTKEINRFAQHDVYEEVKAPKGEHIAGSRWVLKIKYNLDGSPKVFRARLVVQGFLLKPGRDFTKPTRSTVLSQAGLKIALTIIANYNLDACVFDIKSVYLHGWLNKPFLMKAPKGFRKTGPNGKPLVWKVKKSLYGHPAAGYVWRMTLTKWFEKVEMYEADDGEISIFLGLRNG